MQKQDRQKSTANKILKFKVSKIHGVRIRLKDDWF